MLCSRHIWIPEKKIGAHEGTDKKKICEWRSKYNRNFVMKTQRMERFELHSLTRNKKFAGDHSFPHILVSHSSLKSSGSLWGGGLPKKYVSLSIWKIVTSFVYPHTVSYTHLDVYKRQVLAYALSQHSIKFLVCLMKWAFHSRQRSAVIFTELQYIFVSSIQPTTTYLRVHC